MHHNNAVVDGFHLCDSLPGWYHLPHKVFNCFPEQQLHMVICLWTDFVICCIPRVYRMRIAQFLSVTKIRNLTQAKHPSSVLSSIRLETITVMMTAWAPEEGERRNRVPDMFIFVFELCHCCISAIKFRYFLQGLGIHGFIHHWPHLTIPVQMSLKFCLFER